jgi:phosphoheptose isomerase
MSSDASEQLIRRHLNEGAELRQSLAVSSAEQIGAAAVTLEACLVNGNKVLVFGNGGSAADAQHFAAELIGRFRRERDPMPAIALTTDTSVLTAVGNDHGFDRIFVRQVRALARPGDVVVAISTSGRSANVIAAVRAARAAGVTTMALTGAGGGELAPAVDLAIVVPSNDTAIVQEVHIAVIHILCELVESSLPAVIEEPTLAPAEARVIPWSDLLPLREEWRRDGRTVVWTNGCFELLHVGHLHVLEQAKRLGDVLIVGVNSDESVRALKGEGRPIVPLEERMRMLAALDVTDFVVAFGGTTPERPIADLEPDVHVKGEDYAPPSGKPMPERAVVESYGGRVEFVPLLPGHSTSDLIRRMGTRSGG